MKSSVGKYGLAHFQVNLKFLTILFSISEAPVFVEAALRQRSHS